MESDELSSFIMCLFKCSPHSRFSVVSSKNNILVLLIFFFECGSKRTSDNDEKNKNKNYTRTRHTQGTTQEKNLPNQINFLTALCDNTRTKQQQH
jgi:hypothetical protein